MPGSTPTRGQGREAGRDRGLVSGAVLHAVRAGLGSTQTQLAEALQVSVDVIQAWESGRRSLGSVRVADLSRHLRILQRLGADQRRLVLLRHAVEADLVLAEIIRGQHRLDQHPLAVTVPNRSFTELLAWPLGGPAPRLLRDDPPPRLPLPAGEQDDLAARLRSSVDLAGHATGCATNAMLRRQTKYLLAQHAHSQEWIEDLAGRERRSMPDLRMWSPEWPVQRSHAVTEAINGKPEPLARFIRTGLDTDIGISANLTYWAYWTGDIDTPWSSDAEMETTSLHSWTGERLLKSLIDGLREAPYRELCAYSMWALLAAKPFLARTGHQGTLLTKVDLALSIDTLSPGARDKLAQVAFMARSA